MKFLCLAYYEPRKFAAMPPAAVQALVSQCPAHDAALRASGRLLIQASLGEPDSARSLRPVGGRPSFTDGPFAETKEQVGGFFIIDADSIDEARRVAALHPAARIGEEAGWGIEIRPIEHLEQH